MTAYITSAAVVSPHYAYTSVADASCAAPGEVAWVRIRSCANASCGVKSDGLLVNTSWPTCWLELDQGAELYDEQYAWAAASILAEEPE